MCHLAYTFYENDNRVLRYAEARARAGDEVDVIALRRHGQSRTERVGQVRLLRIQQRSVSERRSRDYLLKLLLFFVRAAWELTWLQLTRRYDVVHVHNVPDFLVFAAVAPKLLGAKLILDIHDIVPELYAGKFGALETSRTFRYLLLVERSSCRFADHVIVANHLWHPKLVQRSVKASKCFVILNYPDLNIFSLLKRPADRGRFTVLYPGTLNHHQGVDVAIRAFAQASLRMDGAEFHIYGEGPAKPALAQLIADLDIGHRVKLRDRVPLAAVAPIMADADIGVVPKRADGFGNEAFSTKILEFMACGVPVLVSRTQVDAHYFTPRLVRFFESGQTDDLADAMIWAYQHRHEHGDWIRRAHAFAVEHSWQARASDYHAIVDGLVGTGRPAKALALMQSETD